MSARVYIVFLLTVAGFCYSCSNKTGARQRPASNSDTAIVMHALFDSTVELPRLADVDLLFKYNPYGNSILLWADSALVDYLPANHRFTILSEQEVTRLEAQYKDSVYSPNYLRVDIWKQTDSTYTAVLRNFHIGNKTEQGSILCPACMVRMSFLKKDGQLISKMAQDEAGFQGE